MDIIFCTAGDLWVAAQTAWGEARNQGEQGLAAVLWVIRNRHVYHRRWKQHSLTSICQEPLQFSCWNVGNPNLAQLQQVLLTDTIFRQALHLALDVYSVTASTTSLVGKSTHYYVAGSRMPLWASGRTPYVQIKDHLFFERIA